MYAVIESGNKQYRVELGSEIQVDRLEAQPGDSITLDRVLLVADGDAAAIGRPVVDGAVVSAEVLGQVRGDKIIVFKYKPKARTRVKKGFRAELTTLRISDIAFDGKSAADDAQASEAKKAKAAKEAEKAAAAKAAADQELAAKLATATETATEPETTKTKAKAAPKKKSTADAAVKKAADEPVAEAQVAAADEPVTEAQVAAADEPVAEAEVAAADEPVAEAEVAAAAEPEAEAQTDSDAEEAKKDE
jgi:large subunit ribosomal protein L21